MNQNIARVKIKDVAELAGVSTATVSHVINNTRFVVEETRQKVLAAITATGYQPNIHARNLGARNNAGPEPADPPAAPPQNSATHLFGLLIPGLGQTEIFEPLCQGMARAGRAGGHALLWGDTTHTSANKEQQLERLCEYYISREVSGIFFAPLELTAAKDNLNQSVTEKLEQARIPVVLLDRDLVAYPQRSRFDLVGIDNRRVGYVNTEHLLQHGCQRPAFFAVPDSAPTVAARIAGFQDALSAVGRGPGCVYLGAPKDVGAIRRFLSESRPDGLVCGNDLTAALLMQTLDKLKVRIPDDIRVVGVDDVKYAGLLAVPLTTIHQPCPALGEVAVAAMLERIRWPDLPARDILLDFRLVLRSSCGCH